MVQVIYTKEQGLKQQSGSALFQIPSDIVVGHSINQTVEGNTVAVIDFGNVAHSATPANATQINLNSKYILFRSVNGTEFHVWWDVGGAGAADPAVTANGIEVSGDASNIQGQLVTALNGDADWSAEFFATADGNTVKICALRMGQSGSIADISNLVGVTTGQEGTLYSASVQTTQGVGTHIVNGLGLSKVKSASALSNNSSFVILKNLEAGKNHGLRKIIISELPTDVTIKSESNASLAVFDTAGDAAQFVWNGTAWKAIYTP